MGGVSGRTYAATLPPDRFYCLLDDLPLHLIPKRTLRLWHGQSDQEHPLFLNPDCTFRSDGHLPEELSGKEELISRFALQGTIAWVRDPVASALLPFWLGPRLESALREARPNQPVSSKFLGDSTAFLSAAGILLPEAQLEKSDHDEIEPVTSSRRQFREKGYVGLGKLIHPFHVAALRRYYRYLIRTGAISLGDRQSPRRYVAYNEPVARFFHHHIAPTISAVAGEPVKPSYVYLASYLSGAELNKHTDREQCEFSVTLCLDFSPEPTLETPWPIELETPSGAIAVYQQLGDGLAYRGTRLPHYRRKLGKGQTSTSIFFHYVAADFAGSLN
jgi:hypothetical protein